MNREMKDSGIPWIGEIPKEWSIAKVKHHFYRKKEKALQEEPIVLSLARSGVKVRDISNNEGQVAVSYFEYNPVAIDDLLLNPMDLYSGANCSLSKVEGVISPAYVNLRYLENTYPKYYDYYFKTQYWAMALFAHGKGISFDNRWTLGNETLMNYYIPSPSFFEQKAITEFLDRKCGEIDELIALQERMIEELKAYKQSVITEAVTKGLNPNAPLKDSGIEWIGQIPEHWEIDKIIRLFDKIGSGTTPKSTDETNFNGSINWIQSGDINGGILNHCKNQISEKTLEEYSALKVFKSPFIIIAMYGASVGNTSLSMIDSTVNQACCVLSGGKMNTDYSFAVIKSCKDYWLRQAVGGSQPNISQETIKSSWLPVPPLSEQQEISDYLDKKGFEIDRLIALKQTKIEELKDYKKSIIYEYVTGKKQLEIF